MIRRNDLSTSAKERLDRAMVRHENKLPIAIRCGAGHSVKMIDAHPTIVLGWLDLGWALVLSPLDISVMAMIVTIMSEKRTLEMFSRTKKRFAEIHRRCVAICTYWRQK